mmetsp:Transcript_2747/g.4143  ORF Transcript_2747/g.4143 Transcript_2747/m.4143 type:complete len:185 (-) Transcript_2747:143-697(-)
MSSDKCRIIKASNIRKCMKQKASNDVMVIQCPSGFPSLGGMNSTPSLGSKNKSNTERNRYSSSHGKRGRSKDKHLDWSQTARDIHSFGAAAFQGKQKREYENEQYEMLTGRKKKHHKVPVKIVRGIKKKQAAREKRELEIARESGLIIPSSRKKKQERQLPKNIHGPAPSIGFLKKGVFRVKKP